MTSGRPIRNGFRDDAALRTTAGADELGPEPAVALHPHSGTLMPTIRRIGLIGATYRSIAQATGRAIRLRRAQGPRVFDRDIAERCVR